MSLARLGLRVCAVEALRDRTVVAGNVKDSDISAIDIAADGAVRTAEDAPFILVYTDESAASSADLRDLRQNGSVDFVCEFGVTAAMVETDPDTGDSEIIGGGLAATDANFEMTLDLIDRQIVNALTDPDSEWAEVWRKFSDKVEKIERRRLVDADNGRRMAFRQMRITLACKPDPVTGAPLSEGSVFMRFKALADVHLPPIVPTIEAMLGAPDATPTYEMLRRSRGHTEGEAQRLGYPPQHADQPDATVQSYPIEDEFDGDPA